MASGPAASRDRHRQRANPAPGHTNASAAQPPHAATHLKRIPVDRLRLAGARLARRNPPVARRDPGAAARGGGRRHRHRPAPRRRRPPCPGRRPLACLALDGAAGAPARRPRPAPAGRHRALPLPIRFRRPALGRRPAAVPGPGAGGAGHGVGAGRPAVRLGAPRTRGASSPHPLPRQRSVRPTAAPLTGSLKAGGCVSPFDPALLAATYRLQVSPIGHRNNRARG